MEIQRSLSLRRQHMPQRSNLSQSSSRTDINQMQIDVSKLIMNDQDIQQELSNTDIQQSTINMNSPVYERLTQVGQVYKSRAQQRQLEKQQKEALELYHAKKTSGAARQRTTDRLYTNALNKIGRKAQYENNHYEEYARARSQSPRSTRKFDGHLQPFYDRQAATIERRKQLMEQKIDPEEEEMLHFTGTPTICRQSKYLRRGVSDLQAWEDRKKYNIMQKRRNVQSEEVSACKFSPNICNKSRILADAYRTKEPEKFQNMCLPSMTDTLYSPKKPRRKLQPRPQTAPSDPFSRRTHSFKRQNSTTYTDSNNMYNTSPEVQEHNDPYVSLERVIAASPRELGKHDGKYAGTLTLGSAEGVVENNKASTRNKQPLTGIRCNWKTLVDANGRVLTSVQFVPKQDDTANMGWANQQKRDSGMELEPALRRLLMKSNSRTEGGRQGSQKVEEVESEADMTRYIQQQLRLHDQQTKENEAGSVRSQHGQNNDIYEFQQFNHQSPISSKQNKRQPYAALLQNSGALKFDDLHTDYGRAKSQTLNLPKTQNMKVNEPPVRSNSFGVAGAANVKVPNGSSMRRPSVQPIASPRKGSIYHENCFDVVSNVTPLNDIQAKQPKPEVVKAVIAHSEQSAQARAAEGSIANALRKYKLSNMESQKYKERLLDHNCNQTDGKVDKSMRGAASKKLNQPRQDWISRTTPVNPTHGAGTYPANKNRPNVTPQNQTKSPDLFASQRAPVAGKTTGDRGVGQTASAGESQEAPMEQLCRQLVNKPEKRFTKTVNPPQAKYLQQQVKMKQMQQQSYNLMRNSDQRLIAVQQSKVISVPQETGDGATATSLNTYESEVVYQDEGLPPYMLPEAFDPSVSKKAGKVAGNIQDNKSRLVNQQQKQKQGQVINKNAKGYKALMSPQGRANETSWTTESETISKNSDNQDRGKEEWREWLAQVQTKVTQIQ